MSRILIKNLPASGVKEDDIKRHFADIDAITEIKLKHNDRGKFRRFGFVGFKSSDAAERAISKLDNTFIKTSRISLEPCKAIRETKDANQEEIKRKSRNSPDRGSNENPTKKVKPSRPADVEQVENEPEFEEFMSLQRNVGDKSQAKQVWADDAILDTTPLVEGPPIGGMQVDAVHEEASTEGKKFKKHKRSRPKKKSTKTKPKELFTHTAKIQGIPEGVRRKDVIDFFKPLSLLSIRINKKDGVCYVAFKDDSDLRFGLRKNMQFWKTSRIRMARHNVERSRIYKEAIDKKFVEKQSEIKRYEDAVKDAEPIEETGRLFVRNLSYTCTQDDLEEVFSKYGQLTEVHMPIDKTTSVPKGYAYVEFMFPANASQAYKELNGTIFQGRNFHLIPSKPKPERSLARPLPSMAKADAKSTYQRDKLKEKKETASKASNWNILFLGQNAIADQVSEMKGVEKSKLLTQQTHKDPIAVRVALGDTMIVEQLREFLISNGIELDSFDNPTAPRSRNVIIVKNLPTSTSRHELSALFELHGKVGRVIMPPNGLTAIVEMDEAVEAKLAFKKLAYSKFKDSVLYLEWAPINVFKEKSVEEQKQSDTKELTALQTGTKILVKNVAFEATVQELKKIFQMYGELNFVRIPKKPDGQHRGFGFVDYLTKEDALRAFQALCHSTHLYGRKLVLEWAKSDSSTNNDPASERTN